MVYLVIVYMHSTRKDMGVFNLVLNIQKHF